MNCIHPSLFGASKGGHNRSGPSVRIADATTSQVLLSGRLTRRPGLEAEYDSMADEYDATRESATPDEIAALAKVARGVQDRAGRGRGHRQVREAPHGPRVRGHRRRRLAQDAPEGEGEGPATSPARGRLRLAHPGQVLRCLDHHPCPPRRRGLAARNAGSRTRDEGPSDVDPQGSSGPRGAAIGGWNFGSGPEFRAGLSCPDSAPNVAERTRAEGKGPAAQAGEDQGRDDIASGGRRHQKPTGQASHGCADCSP